MRNFMKQSKAITLIALVITIIVLLILAGVTIATLTGDNGLLQKATDAKQKNEEAAALEKIQVEVIASYKKNGTIDIEDKLNQNLKKINGLTYNNNEIDLNDTNKKITKLPATVKLNGYAFTISENGDVSKIQWIDNNNGSYTNAKTGQTLTVGDTVKYENILNENAVDNDKLSQLKSDLQNYSGDSSSTDNANIARDSLTWKLLDIKDGQIRLISSIPTNKKINLNNFDGYNNAVYLIDEACNVLYGSNIGFSKNLKIEDIEEKIDKTQFDYTQYPNSNVDTGKYGGTKEYSSNLKYPNIYINEIGCKAVSSTENKGTLTVSEQKKLVTGRLTATDNKLKATQTLWIRTIQNTDFIDTKYNNVILNNLSTYWLSSRCVACDSSLCGYGCYYIEPGRSVNYNWLYLSTGDTNYDNKSFRPVVTLNSDVQLEADGTNTWKIK